MSNNIFYIEIHKNIYKKLRQLFKLPFFKILYL
nr:MAG TPA: hypothetical protein [Caudoviricetes sp.]